MQQPKQLIILQVYGRAMRTSFSQGSQMAPDALPHPLVSTGVYSCLCKFTLNWEGVLGEQVMIKSISKTF